MALAGLLMGYIQLGLAVLGIIILIIVLLFLVPTSSEVLNNFTFLVSPLL